MKEKWNVLEPKGEVMHPAALRLQIHVTKAWEMSSQHLHVSHSTRVRCIRSSHDWELKSHSTGVYFGKKLIPAARVHVTSSKCSLGLFQQMLLDGKSNSKRFPAVGWRQNQSLSSKLAPNFASPTWTGRYLSSRLSYLFVEQRKDNV